jgi:hypothetical protein
MKVLGIAAWILVGFCAFSSVGYIFATIRRPTVVLTSCIFWWIASIWPFFFPNFNRLHLFWIIPFAFVLPWIVEFVILPVRVRYYYRKRTPVDKIPDFSRTAFILSVGLFLIAMKLL